MEQLVETAENDAAIVASERMSRTDVNLFFDCRQRVLTQFLYSGRAAEHKKRGPPHFHQMIFMWTALLKLSAANEWRVSCQQNTWKRVYRID